MSLFDDDRSKKKPAHEIGQDISLLSAGELDERITLLQAEIARLDADRASKLSSKAAADALFRKP